MGRFLKEWLFLQIIFVIVFLIVMRFINNQSNQYDDYEAITATVVSTWESDDTYYGTVKYEYDSLNYEATLSPIYSSQETVVLYVDPSNPTSIISQTEMDEFNEANEKNNSNLVIKIMIVVLVPVAIAGFDAYNKYKRGE